MSRQVDPPTLFIVCPGLGHVRRGHEAFGRECFEALTVRDEVRAVLVKGRGRRAPREWTVLAPRRDRALARAVGSLTDNHPYTVEQAFFAAGLIPLIAAYRPDVLLYTDGMVGRVLARWRSVTRAGFALLLCNGAPDYPPFLYPDHVQQLNPSMLQLALEAGEPADKHTLLPQGVAMPRPLPVVGAQERARMRRSLALPPERRVVLSVAAVNHSHKRLDYVAEELASLPEPRPYLVVVGEEDPEQTPRVRRVAEAALGRAGFTIRAPVPPPILRSYYMAADAFVLASLGETLGRSLVEAMAFGLPCIAHDYPVARFVLGEHGSFGDLSRRGELAKRVSALGEADLAEPARRARHEAVYGRFSWDALLPRYLELIRACAAAGPRRAE